jgi:hypothetical protein
MIYCICKEEMTNPTRTSRESQRPRIGANLSSRGSVGVFGQYSCIVGIGMGLPLEVLRPDHSGLAFSVGI